MADDKQEGYFAINHKTMGGLQDIFAQLWKEYALSDSRYLTQDPFVLCMETITAVCASPPTYLRSWTPRVLYHLYHRQANTTLTVLLGTPLLLRRVPNHKTIASAPSLSDYRLTRPALRRRALLRDLHLRSLQL